MFSNIFVIALTFSGLATVYGFYEVSVTDAETQRQCPPAGGVDKYMECVAPLIQLANVEHKTYAQTANQEEALALALGKGYTYRGILGRVVTKKEGCECSDGTELVPVHLLTKSGTYDYMLSAGPFEIEGLKQSGYTDKRIDFYCSPEKDKCGATLPLYRHTSQKGLPFFTVYTTSANQDKLWDADGCKSDRVVCYVWPKLYNAQSHNGQT